MQRIRVKRPRKALDFAFLNNPPKKEKENPIRAYRCIAPRCSFPSHKLRRTSENPSFPFCAFCSKRSANHFSNRLDMLRHISIRAWISAVCENTVWDAGRVGEGV